MQCILVCKLQYLVLEKENVKQISDFFSQMPFKFTGNFSYIFRDDWSRGFLVCVGQPKWCRLPCHYYIHDTSHVFQIKKVLKLRSVLTMLLPLFVILFACLPSGLCNDLMLLRQNFAVSFHLVVWFAFISK